MGIFGVFGKVLPWKRKDELGLKEEMALGNMGLGPAENLPLGYGQPMQGMQGMQQYQQPFGGMGSSGGAGGVGGMGGMGGLGGLGGMPQGPGPQQPQMEAFQANQAYERSYAAGKEIEVVSAKLDAIRAALETLNQRLAAIERYMQTEQDFKKRGW